MQAIILAAGQGTRLRPFTESRPKCLVPVCGRPLLETHLKVLGACGVSPVTLVGGYKADCLQNYGDHHLLNPDFASTNMVWTLRYALEKFSQGCVLAYGDIVYSPAALEALLRHSGDICVVVDKSWKSYWRKRFKNPLDDAETLRISNDGLLVEIGNKPESFDDIHAQYIGLMKFSSRGAAVARDAVEAAVAKNSPLNGKPVKTAYMTDLLQHLCAMQYSLHPVAIDGEWAEIDAMNDIAIAEERIIPWAKNLLHIV